jgi:hypothetical protein
MGNIVGSDKNHHYEVKNNTDGFFTFIDVKSEEIHEILNSAYVILTSDKPFEKRKKELKCIYRLIQPLINVYLPHMFQFIKDCYGYEYFIFIGTIGYYAIDIVLYWDLKDWTSLNTGSSIRTYSRSGTSKLQYSVTKRLTPSTSEEVMVMEHRKREIDDIIKYNKFYYGPDTIVDFRCKPKVHILQPKNDEVLYNNEVEVQFDVYNLTLNDYNIKVYLDGCEVACLNKPEPVKVYLKHPGYNRIDVKVIDKYNRFNIKSSVKVLLECSNITNSESLETTDSTDYPPPYYHHHRRHRRHHTSTTTSEDFYDGCQSDSS